MGNPTVIIVPLFPQKSKHNFDTKNVRLKCQAPKPSSRPKKNYEELKDFLPQNGNEENYALLTHYLLMGDGEAKSQKREELLNRFEFTEEKLSEAEKFFSTKNIAFRHKGKPSFTFIDLFAGIGGFRLAMQASGGECVFSSEWDDAAKQTYYENYGEVPFGDITKDETKALIPEHFDVLCAGFPCQAFSMAGHRKGFQDNYKGICRGTLFMDVAKICDTHRPKIVFCENVKGLVIHDKGRTFKIIKSTFESLGYKVFSQILNSKDFGVPQNRERIYIVALRNDFNIEDFLFPKGTRITKKIKDIMEEEPVPSKYYLSTTYIETLKRHRARHEAKGHGFGYEIRDINGIAGAIVCGGMGRERNLIVDKRQKNLTPTTHIKGTVNTDGIRKMTPREWARLQGFPDSYRMILADTHLYKQFGNSVSVPVITNIGKQIKRSLDLMEN